MKVVLKRNICFSKQTLKDFFSELISPSVPSLGNFIRLPTLIFANTQSEYDASIDFICRDSTWWNFFWNMAGTWIYLFIFVLYFKRK